MLFMKKLSRFLIDIGNNRGQAFILFERYGKKSRASGEQSSSSSGSFSELTPVFTVQLHTRFNTSERGRFHYWLLLIDLTVSAYSPPSSSRKKSHL